MSDGGSVAEVMLIRPMAILKRNPYERERGELSEAHRRWPARRRLDLICYYRIAEKSVLTRGATFTCSPSPSIHEGSVDHLPKGAFATEPIAINLILLPLGGPRFNGN
jgi:hypothetical protein